MGAVYCATTGVTKTAMPSTSKAQAGFWAKAATDPAFAAAHGIEHKTAQEWHAEDKARGIGHLPARAVASKSAQSNGAKKPQFRGLLRGE